MSTRETPPLDAERGAPSPAPPPRFRHRLEYALFRAALGAGLRLSDARAERLGERIGRLGYRPLRIRRAVGEAHLRLAFPEHDEAWRRRVLEASYAHIGRETMVMLRLAGTAPDALVARSELEDPDGFRDLLAPGHGMVAAAGHLGNWELGAALVALRGFPVDVVAQRQHNPLFDAAIVAARRRLGVGVIERSRAHRLALRSLRAGRIVAFAADQNAGRAGIFVPFFGRLASTHRGPALMALRTGAPLIVVRPLRTPEGGYRLGWDLVDASRDGDPETVVHRLTAAFTARLEAAVRSTPEQYLWLHRRWKTRPPEEPAGAGPV